jgi:hypothetical protein
MKEHFCFNGSFDFLKDTTTPLHITPTIISYNNKPSLKLSLSNHTRKFNISISQGTAESYNLYTYTPTSDSGELTLSDNITSFSISWEKLNDHTLLFTNNMNKISVIYDSSQDAVSPANTNHYVQYLINLYQYVIDLCDKNTYHPMIAHMLGCPSDDPIVLIDYIYDKIIKANNLTN